VGGLRYSAKSKDLAMGGAGPLSEVVAGGAPALERARSDAASYVQGAVLNVDGGRTAV
jgi:hypothetical protein